MAPTKTCFFVTPIGADASPERIRANQVQQYVLNPVLGNEYEIVRADEVDDAGDITHDIVARLFSADIVVADLTGQNPNVMYEVGIRHTLNKPIAYLAKSVQELPFDVSGERTIPCDTTNLDSVEEAKQKLGAMVRKLQVQRNYRSPVAKVLELEDLFYTSENEPVSRSMLELLEEISGNVDDLQGEITSLQFQMDYPSTDPIAHLDSRTDQRIRELLRIFDQVGPSDLARIALALKRL